MTDTSSLHPGFMIVQGNRLDDLRHLVVGVMRRYPLAPLENEIALVQSNGIAQWLKLALAEDPQEGDQGGCGIAAAIDVQLPGSFMWQLYRRVLGRDEIPEVSLLDKAPLTWRLMRLLPELIERPHFEPLRRFLTDDGDLRKRYQLAERLADLFDQYQVYRADWLKDWAVGEHVLNSARGERKPLPVGNRWQAQLWRALLEDVGEAGMAQSRAGVHQRFIERINSLDQAPSGLPKRVIVFGISSLPAQALEALAGLARFSQVLLCVHNPCRHHWADIVADKDLLRHQYKRQQRKHGTPCNWMTKACISMLIHYWLPGASRAVTTSTFSTVMMTPAATAVYSARVASTFSKSLSQTACFASCRMTFSSCAHWPKPASSGLLSIPPRIARCASMWPTVRSEKWRSFMTSCWPASVQIPRCARVMSSSCCRPSTTMHRISARSSANLSATTLATFLSLSPTKASVVENRC